MKIRYNPHEIESAFLNGRINQVLDHGLGKTK